MATLAGEDQEIFMAAIFAFYTGKAVVRDAAIEIAINHLLEIELPGRLLPSEMFITEMHKGYRAYFVSEEFSSYPPNSNLAVCNRLMSVVPAPISRSLASRISFST